MFHRHDPSHPTRKGLRNDLGAFAAISLLTVFAILATACGGGGGGEGGGDNAVQEGRKIFSRVCATCHGQDAKGLPRLGKGLLNNEFVQSLSDQELVEFLKTGRPATHPLNETGVDMPPRGGDPSISDEDLHNVVAYVRTLQ
jgi:disulfide bond formation protein DsbB